MRVKTKRKRNMRQIAGDLLLWLGIWMAAVGFGYEAINYPWSALFQEWGWMSVQTDLPDPMPVSAEWAEATQPKAVAALPQETRTLARPPANLKMLGVIKLPRIGIAENIVEGCESELYYAVGHIPGTALPGQEGNCVLGGHRNYIPMHPFRHLDMLKKGDVVLLEDQKTRYTYEVYETFIVKPSDVWIIEPLEEEKNVLTLFTCTPVLTMTDRLVVRCRLASQTPLNPEERSDEGIVSANETH